MLVSEEPLNFPLNFTWTVKATSKAGAALLVQGDYHAISIRVYKTHQACYGCGVREKAKTLIVAQNRDTGETFEIGLQCMGDLYGVDITRLQDHAKGVTRARLSLGVKLGLSGDLSTAQQLAIVREAVATYAPVPERLLRELDAIDVWTPTKHDEDRIRDLHQLACYHREWQEAPEWAQRRWKALQHHPAFAFTPKKRDEVRQLCERALKAGVLLSEHEVITLNLHLRTAAAFKHGMPRLEKPDDFDSAEAYMAALEAHLHVRAQVGQPLDLTLSGDREASRFKATDRVSVPAKQLYAVAAVWDDEAEGFAQALRQTEAYYKGGVRRPIVVVGERDRQDTPARMATRRRKDNSIEEYEQHKAWTFRYRRVAWALVEPHTPTYALWRTFGRSKLESYT